MIRMLSVVMLAGTAILLGQQSDAGDKSPTGRLKGKITFEGKPVRMGVLTIASADGKEMSISLIKGDGTYDFAIVPAGKVIIGYELGEPGPKEKESKAQHIKELKEIPEHYQDPTKSGLTTTVQAGKTNVYDIKMVKKKAK